MDKQAQEIPRAKPCAECQTTYPAHLEHEHLGDGTVVTRRAGTYGASYGASGEPLSAGPLGFGFTVHPKVVPLVESRRRTLARSVTWRIGGVALALALAYVVTGNLGASLELGVAYNAIRLVTHYAHDRAWLRVRWGLIVE